MCSQIFAPHELFLAPDAVGLHNLLLAIGQEGKRQLEFPCKLSVRFHRIRADSQNDHATFFELRERITEPTSLLGASGCIVPRIEVEKYVSALEVCQRDGLTVLSHSLKIGSVITFLQFQ